MNKSLYTNIAFISYKHEDEAWAKWLQKKLQYYKLPVDICKKHPNLEFSECPRHVFKDTTDLSGGVLAKAIKAGLDSSKFLIVICSPRAAKSEWVCKEVQEFIDSGREEYIIPFIIEGEPHAKNKENECFPSTLKSLAGERELLGINVNENGREAASVKVAARMFGLSYDSLWQRFKREEKKKRRNIIATFITAIIILLSIIAYGIWANRRITEERDKANIANNQLFAANKRITKQKGKLQEANDSILKQKSALQQAFNNLAKTEHALTQSNNDLKEKNYQLKIERDNVLKANWGMQENQARAVSEKAKELISNGNVLKGAYLSLSVLPKDRNSTIRPFVINAEQALRSAYDSLVYGKKSFALLEQNGQVLHTSFSEDSKYILTTSNDGKIRIWETCTGQETNFISPYFGQSILSAYFVGSDKIISFLYDGSVYLINIKTGIKKHINISGTNPVFSNNKKKFALSQNKDNIIKIFNTDTWETIDKIQANTLTFSPIDNKIAYVNNGEVIIKDGNIIINRWKCINSRIVYSLQYSPDGRSLLICTNDSLSLWDIESTAKISSYTEEGGFNGAIYTKDGKHIVTQSESGKVLFFHKNNFKRPFYMFQYPSSVEKIDFSPNNEYFSEFNFKIE
jgi:WD40 repeat protein/cell division protein FtsB